MRTIPDTRPPRSAPRLSNTNLTPNPSRGRPLVNRADSLRLVQLVLAGPTKNLLWAMARSRFSRLHYTKKSSTSETIERGNRVQGINITMPQILAFRRTSTLSATDGLKTAFCEKIAAQHFSPTLLPATLVAASRASSYRLEDWLFQR